MTFFDGTNLIQVIILNPEGKTLDIESCAVDGVKTDYRPYTNQITKHIRALAGKTFGHEQAVEAEEYLRT